MLEDLKRMLGLPLHEDEELDKKLDDSFYHQGKAESPSGRH